MSFPTTERAPIGDHDTRLRSVPLILWLVSTAASVSTLATAPHEPPSARHSKASRMAAAFPLSSGTSPPFASFE